MMTSVFSMIRTIIAQCLTWFTNILSAVGGTEVYYTAIFTVLTCGFLLSRFGSGLRIGSDIAAQSIKKRRGKE